MGNEMVETQIEQAMQSWTPREVMAQVNAIQQLMRDGMTDGEHFGVIPGTNSKKVLLKPGAEKLCLMFRLAPKFEITEKDMGNGHMNINVVCSLQHINTGKFWGSGVGSCSTMESKYRYRTGQGASTGIVVPKGYWDLKRTDPKKAQEIIGVGYGTKKEDGVWYICEKIEKQENPDIADVYNTVLKIAKKRALVDATLTATAASDIFTQDLEETLPEATIVPQSQAPKAAEPPKTAPESFISHDFQLEIHRKAKEMGITPSTLKNGLKEVFGLDGTAKITLEAYPRVIEWLVKHDSAEVGK